MGEADECNVRMRGEGDGCTVRVRGGVRVRGEV